MKFKVPPALVMLVFGGLMYLLAQFLPIGEFDFFGRKELSYGLLALGLLVILISLSLIHI